MSGNEHEIKRLLESYGIKRPEYWIVPPSDFSEILSSLPRGKRFVAKVLDGEIKHKSEVGAVHVDLTKDELGVVIMNFWHKFPQRAILIEEYIPHAVEFILGVKKDENFELVVCFGAGGFLTEIYGDIAFSKLPLTKKEIVRMVNSTKISAVFKGFRGIHYDYVAIEKAVNGIQKLFDEKGDDVAQLEINPFIICDSEPVALDAKIVLTT
ncbi:MAG: acetate--CoA ligase family protein [Thermoplasmata archaeon]